MVTKMTSFEDQQKLFESIEVLAARSHTAFKSKNPKKAHELLNDLLRNIQILKECNVFDMAANSIKFRNEISSFCEPMVDASDESSTSSNRSSNEEDENSTGSSESMDEDYTDDEYESYHPILKHQSTQTTFDTPRQKYDHRNGYVFDHDLGMTDFNQSLTDRPRVCAEMYAILLRICQSDQIYSKRCKDSVVLHKTAMDGNTQEVLVRIRAFIEIFKNSLIEVEDLYSSTLICRYSSGCTMPHRQGYQYWKLKMSVDELTGLIVFKTYEPFCWIDKAKLNCEYDAKVQIFDPRGVYDEVVCVDGLPLWASSTPDGRIVGVPDEVGSWVIECFVEYYCSGYRSSKYKASMQTKFDLVVGLNFDDRPSRS